MLHFDKSKTKELEDYLYRSAIHDAVFKSSQYNTEKRMLSVEVFNPIYNIEIHFVFCDVKIVLFIPKNEIGSGKTINSLTVEDCVNMERLICDCNEKLGDALYLLFQMFSDDELHVVCEKLFIEESRDDSSEL